MSADHQIPLAHITAFGSVINSMTRVEAALDAMILAMIGGKEIMTLPLLSMLGIKDKRDYIAAMSKETYLPPESVAALDKLLTRVKTAATLRNNVAHCVWKPGRKPESLKPLIMSARQKLKLIGTKDNEKDWTAQELLNEANNNERLASEIHFFAQNHGLFPNIARTISLKKTDNSESDKG